MLRKFIRRIISLAAFSLPLSLLILSACGRGSGGGTAPSPGNFVPVSSSGGLMVSTFAGTANPGEDGVGAAARFHNPGGVVTDGLNLYVADTINQTIRKIVISTGAVSTLAGKVGVTGSVDGFGTTATFSSPTGIAIDSSHTYLYVADTGNNNIRRVMISSGAVTSFTGTPYAAVTAGAIDGAASGASFKQHRGIAVDSTDTYLYVADTGNNKIRQIAIASGVVSSYTGVGNTAGATGHADGAPSAATFSGPSGIAIVGSALYVADYGNNTIRRIQ